ncbi:MAG: DUF4870 domain-containing protein [Flavobacteriales bacterium]
MLKTDHTTVALLHYAQLLNAITGIGGLIAAVIIWQMKKDGVAGMDENGREVMNFQISLIIYSAAAGILVFALGLGLLLYPFIWLAGIVFPVIGGIRAAGGSFYRYPLAIRFL